MSRPSPFVPPSKENNLAMVGLSLVGEDVGLAVVGDLVVGRLLSLDLHMTFRASLLLQSSTSFV